MSLWCKLLMMTNAAAVCIVGIGMTCCQMQHGVNTADETLRILLEDTSEDLDDLEPLSQMTQEERIEKIHELRTTLVERDTVNNKLRSELDSLERREGMEWIKDKANRDKLLNPGVANDERELLKILGSDEISKDKLIHIEWCRQTMKAWEKELTDEKLSTATDWGMITISQEAALPPMEHCLRMACTPTLWPLIDEGAALESYFKPCMIAAWKHRFVEIRTSECFFIKTEGFCDLPILNEIATKARATDKRDYCCEWIKGKPDHCAVQRSVATCDSKLVIV